VRHESFGAPAFVRLLRRHRVPVVYADSDRHPEIADGTGDFVYARLQRSAEDVPTGYEPAALDRWAGVFRTWEAGGVPEGLPLIEPAERGGSEPRPCFVFFISGAKVRAPAAAMALIERLRPEKAT
jgi:uncharacterized protein YecE (DUF72 family)